MARQATFEFKRALTPIGFVWIPTAEVEFRCGARSIEVEMTVDSGADLIMIPLLVGLSLGLKKARSPLRRLRGVAGGVPYLLKRVRLRLGPFSFPARIAWAQSDDVPMLLGRGDVFNRFNVTFDERRRRVTFTR